MIKAKRDEDEDEDEEESSDSAVGKFVNRRNVSNHSPDYTNYERLCRGEETRVSIFHSRLQYLHRVCGRAWLNGQLIRNKRHKFIKLHSPKSKVK